MLEVRIELGHGSKLAVWMTVDISVDVFRIGSWFLIPSIAIRETVEPPCCNGWRSSQVSTVTVSRPKICDWFEEVAVVARQPSRSGSPLAGVAVRLTVVYRQDSDWQDHGYDLACDRRFGGAVYWLQVHLLVLIL
jgi:hypothetical protein